MRAKRVNDTTVNVSWKQLSLTKAKGFIKSYTVFIASGAKREHQNTASFKTVPSTESSVVFTNLQGNLDYTVSVFASTVVGQGPANTIAVQNNINGNDNVAVITYHCILLTDSTSSVVIETNPTSSDGTYIIIIIIYFYVE